MSEWTIQVETFGEERDELVPDEVFDRFAEELEPYSGVAGLGNSGWSATFTVESESAPEAAGIGADIAVKAAARAGLPEAWASVKVLSVTNADLFAERLDEPQFPAVVGTTEVAKVLGVSKQRLQQLRSAGRFPEPFLEAGNADLAPQHDRVVPRQVGPSARTPVAWPD